MTGTVCYFNYPQVVYENARSYFWYNVIMAEVPHGIYFYKTSFNPAFYSNI